MGRNLDATVLLSGGIDSAACAAFLATQGLEVRALFIDYGQAAAKQEAAAAQAVASGLNIKLKRVVVDGGDSFGAGELVGRNSLFVFTALFFSPGRIGPIALGLHAGTPYYDCSPAFIELANKSVAEHTDGKVQVIAPFIHWSKRDVYEYFIACGLSISWTYSCERGQTPGCGTCASCRDRKTLGC